MRETATAAYPQRTRLNVRDADATLILTRGEPAGGTAFTIACAERLDRPCMLVDLTRPDLEQAAATVREWLDHEQVRVLNVAGPRESSAPGIAEEAAAFLRSVLGRRRSASLSRRAPSPARNHVSIIGHRVFIERLPNVTPL